MKKLLAIALVAATISTSAFGFFGWGNGCCRQQYVQPCCYEEVVQPCCEQAVYVSDCGC